MKRVLVLAAFIFAFSQTDVKAAHVARSALPQAPVLNNVTVPFGQYTASGLGSVRLSSQDDNQWSYPGKGVDIQSSSGTPCATWTTTLNSGTAGHFNLISGVSEGSSAKTPTPTNTGQSAHLSAGTYVFNVSCTDANGNVSNTAHLTYNIVANAANVGDTDGNFPAITSGFANFASTSGYSLLMSVGFHKPSTNAAWSIACPVECGLTWADAARPGVMVNFSPHTGTAIINLHDVNMTGDAQSAIANTVLASIYVPGSSSTNTLKVNNVNVAFTDQQGAAFPIKCFYMGWAGTQVSNSSCTNTPVGLGIYGSNQTYSNVVVKHYTVNAIDINTSENVSLSDVLLYDPEVTIGGFHADCMQIANGATFNVWTLRRVSCLTAGGTGASQTIYFPGHMSFGTGYMDNNVTPLTAGHHWHWCGSNPSVFFQGVPNGASFWVPGVIAGGVYNPGPRVANVNTGTGGPDGDIINITDQVIGSSTSCQPAAIWQGDSLDFKGIVQTGWSIQSFRSAQDHGTGGMQNFDFVSQFNSTPYVTTFNGTISGTTLTVNGPTSSNTTFNAGLTSGGVGVGYGISYAGLVGSLSLASTISAPGNCIGQTICTYTLSRAPGNVTNVAMTGSPPTGSEPALSSQLSITSDNADIAYLHDGSGQLFKNGWSQSGYTANHSGTFSSVPPSNTTVTNVWNMTTAPPSTAFANGDPTSAFQAISKATWDAMTPAQVLATHCHYLLPKIGGPLDNGDGTYATAFKLVGGAGQWFDGTPVPGCS